MTTKLENIGTTGWGSFFKFKILTEVRSFRQVEEALSKSGIAEHHNDRVLIERPTASKAFTRSMGYLTRACASSIPFPAGSANLTWTDVNGVIQSGDRNPNYSLKVETIKAANTDGSVSYRINISDRLKASASMDHVLTAVFSADGTLYIKQGVNSSAWTQFGQDLTTLVRDAYDKFFNNYDDTDVRAVVAAEVDSLLAINVMGNTTHFIAKDTAGMPDNNARVVKLAQFVKDCGHIAGVLGLDASAMTRDQLVDELRISLMAEMDEIEEDLDEKLNTPTAVRKRGEKRRESLKAKKDEDIDRVLSLAAYHSTVLGIMAEGIQERANKLKAKANEFLTKDFGDGAPVVRSVAPVKIATEAELIAARARIAELVKENMRKGSYQGIVVQPQSVSATIANIDNPFANVG